ncbi:MAG: deoxynucleoside kinase [Candidatus Wildermuthbacteria bacterium]|nr:deoxynucleoside kinase [Candidatus Wildermuthbacteria bacterium]
MPALEKGMWVITDRYFFSSMAYGTAAGVNLEWIIERNNKLLMPDITFLLKTSPDVCIERIQKRGAPKTLFEYKEHLEKVWKAYESLAAKFPTIAVINGEQSIEAVAKDIRNTLVSQLKLD